MKSLFAIFISIGLAMHLHMEFIPYCFFCFGTYFLALSIDSDRKVK